MSDRQSYNLFSAVRGYLKRVDRKADIETFGGTMRIEVRDFDDSPMFYLSTPFARGVRAHAMRREDLLRLADLCVGLAEEPKAKEK